MTLLWAAVLRSGLEHNVPSPQNGCQFREAATAPKWAHAHRKTLTKQHRGLLRMYIYIQRFWSALKYPNVAGRAVKL